MNIVLFASFTLPFLFFTKHKVITLICLLYNLYDCLNQTRALQNLSFGNYAQQSHYPTMSVFLIFLSVVK